MLQAPERLFKHTFLNIKSVECYLVIIRRLYYVFKQNKIDVKSPKCFIASRFINILQCFPFSNL